MGLTSLMYLYVAFRDPGYVTNEKLGILNGGDLFKDDIERMKSYHDRTLQAKQHSSSSSSATSAKHKKKEVCNAPSSLTLIVCLVQGC